MSMIKSATYERVTNQMKQTAVKVYKPVRKYALENIKRDFKKNYSIYILILPVILFYLYFCYGPMYGAIIAFKDFSPARGIMGSKWVGFEHFTDFFESIYFGRVLKNTLSINIMNLLFGFPAPIILALLINELTHKWFARTIQTITYLPHFISLVVMCSMIKVFTGPNGIIGEAVGKMMGINTSLLSIGKLFAPIYVISDIWQQVGWNSILYLSALSGIDQGLYEAATIDGAGRWKQTIHVTIPCIMPTIIVMFILRMGSMLSVGYEKIILLYSPMVYDTADVISSYVYRSGLQEFKYDYASTVGLFNSFINFALVLSMNMLSKKYNETSLW